MQSQIILEWAESDVVVAVGRIVVVAISCVVVAVVVITTSINTRVLVITISVRRILIYPHIIYFTLYKIFYQLNLLHLQSLYILYVRHKYFFASLLVNCSCFTLYFISFIFFLSFFFPLISYL